MSTIDAREGVVPAADTQPRRLRWRRRLVAVLAVLTCVGMLTSVVAVWTHRTLLNTDAWMEVVGPLGTDPAVTDAVAIALTDQVFQLVQPEAKLAEALPPKAAFLAQPLSTAVHQYVEDGVAKVLQTDQFKQIWEKSNRRVHEAAVKLVRGQPVLGFTATDGVVTFNLFPLITKVLEFIDSKAHGLFGDRTIPAITDQTPPDQARAELAAGLGITIPPTFGVVTVLHSDDLMQAQQLVHLFDKLVFVIVGITLLLFVATILLSTRRRHTLLVLGLGTALAMVLANAAINAFEKQVTGLITGEAARHAATTTIAQLVNSLSAITDVLIAGGLGLVIVAFVAGDSRAAVTIRRTAGAAFGRSSEGSSTIPVLHDHLNAFRALGLLVAMVWLIAIDVTWGSLALVAVVVGAYEVVIGLLGRPSPPDAS